MGLEEGRRKGLLGLIRANKFKEIVGIWFMLALNYWVKIHV
jgi:hypothetical protein